MIAGRTVEGVDALTIATDDGELEADFVPGAGMVGCSLRHRGEELLGRRGGLRRYMAQRSTMGIPLLYPWANRLAGTRFEVAGHEVALDPQSPQLSLDPNGLPMHGLLAAAGGWRVDAHEATSGGGLLAASFDFARHEDLLSMFPFGHRLDFEASLQDTTLTIATAVLASAEAPVPVSFGYHPYLVLPGVDRREWEVEIPVQERLELDDRMLPTGRREHVEVGGGTLGSRTFDDGYLAPADGAPFALSGGGRRIELAVGSGYPFAQVYAPLEDDVIAFEPMTAPTNALVAGGPDLPLVEPGGRYEAMFSISVTGSDR